jgi:hypothetical protein
VAVTVQLNERVAITGELGASYFQWQPGSSLKPGWTVTALLGPSIFFGAEALSGWFISPKLGFLIGHAADSSALIETTGPLDPGGGVGRAFTLGVDAGYQWRRGHLHVALLLGVSLGYGWRVQEILSPFWQELSGSTPYEGFVVAANLNALRLGIAF